MVILLNSLSSVDIIWDIGEKIWLERKYLQLMN